MSLEKVCIIVCLFSIFSCRDTSIGDSGEVKKLLELEHEAITREFQNDTAFLSSLMDTTFIELNNEKIKNKHEVLRTIYEHNVENEKKQISLDSFRLEQPVVHVYDRAAVVTFIMHTFRKKADSLFQRRTRFYDVWIKRENQWKAVTWQGSPVK